MMYVCIETRLGSAAGAYTVLYIVRKQKYIRNSNSAAHDKTRPESTIYGRHEETKIRLQK